MKKLLFILLILPFLSKGQTNQPTALPNPNAPTANYIIGTLQTKGYGVQFLPRVNDYKPLSGMNGIRFHGDTMYIFSIAGNAWLPVTTGGITTTPNWDSVMRHGADLFDSYSTNAHGHEWHIDSLGSFILNTTGEYGDIVLRNNGITGDSTALFLADQFEAQMNAGSQGGAITSLVSASIDGRTFMQSDNNNTLKSGIISAWPDSAKISASVIKIGEEDKNVIVGANTASLPSTASLLWQDSTYRLYNSPVSDLANLLAGNGLTYNNATKKIDAGNSSTPNSTTWTYTTNARANFQKRQSLNVLGNTGSLTAFTSINNFNNPNLTDTLAVIPSVTTIQERFYNNGNDTMHLASNSYDGGALRLSNRLEYNAPLGSDTLRFSATSTTPLPVQRVQMLFHTNDTTGSKNKDTSIYHIINAPFDGISFETYMPYKGTGNKDYNDIHIKASKFSDSSYAGNGFQSIATHRGVLIDSMKNKFWAGGVAIENVSSFDSIKLASAHIQTPNVPSGVQLNVYGEDGSGNWIKAPAVSGVGETFATIAAMEASTTTASSCHVTDSLRGGYFIKYNNASIGLDSGTNFPSASGASYRWCRQYNQTTGLNPDWFGAIGDWNLITNTGTDNVTALRLCLASQAHSNTPMVFSKKGIYGCSDTLVLGTGTLIQGLNPLFPTQYTNATDSINYTIMSGIYFYNNTSGFVTSTTDGNTQRSQGVTIKNIAILGNTRPNTGSAGVLFRRTNNVGSLKTVGLITMHNIYINGFDTSATGYNTADTWHMVECHFTNSYVGVVGGTGQLYVSFCDFYNLETRSIISNAGPTPGDIISNNEIEPRYSDSASILINGQNATVYSNKFLTNKYSIQVSKTAQNTHIFSNDFYQSSNDNIIIDSGSVNTTLTDNKFVFHSVTTSLNYNRVVEVFNSAQVFVRARKSDALFLYNNTVSVGTSGSYIGTYPMVFDTCTQLTVQNSYQPTAINTLPDERAYDFTGSTFYTPYDVADRYIRGNLYLKEVNTPNFVGFGKIVTELNGGQTDGKFYFRGGVPGTVPGMDLTIFKSEGTLSSPTGLLANSILSRISGVGYNTSAFTGTRISYTQVAAQDWSTSAAGTAHRFAWANIGNNSMNRGANFSQAGLYSGDTSTLAVARLQTAAGNTTIPPIVLGVNGVVTTTPIAGALEATNTSLFFTDTVSTVKTRREVVLLDKTQTLTNKTLGSGTVVNTGTVGTGTIWYSSNGTGSVTNLPIGSTNNVLTVVGGIPTWQSASTGANGAFLLNQTIQQANSNGNLSGTFVVNSTRVLPGNVSLDIGHSARIGDTAYMGTGIDSGNFRMVGSGSIYQQSATSYSTGGFTDLVWNNTTGRYETIPFAQMVSYSSSGTVNVPVTKIYYVYADCNSGDITLTFTPSLVNQCIRIKRVDNTGNTLTIAVTGGTVDAGATTTISGLASKDLVPQTLTNCWIF